MKIKIKAEQTIRLYNDNVLWFEMMNDGYYLCNEQKFWFSKAQEITTTEFNNGLGSGFKTVYKGFNDGEDACEVLVWVEESTQDIYFEWLPLIEDKLKPSAVYWPMPIRFDDGYAESYTLINQMQGTLIPNNWPHAVNQLHFDGQLGSSAAYMPWFAQVNQQAGYLAECLDPADAAYQIDHPANGPYTSISIRWLPTLGKMRYRRRMRYSLRANCDYNDLCKLYRQHVKESGLFTSLREKAARNPFVDQLIGSAFVHKGIKSHIEPDSLFYDSDNPEHNDHLTSFDTRTEEIKQYHEMGIKKLYLHLDGWAEPGYDNQHPDILPPCIQAGGWDGLKKLSDTMQTYNYMLGLHDQYRDYYFNAKSFDPANACMNEDGSIFDMARWAGGRQSLLCASQAAMYVKRNFTELLKHGIHLEASYLDVFTCNEGDECFNPEHMMNRKECFEYRRECFSMLNSMKILPSSEECGDWAMRELVFAHYGPYDFMLKAPDTPRNGYPVPLFNLVYHDCMLLPWPMDQHPDQEDYMLYALLNGGGAYLEKEGAYPNTDGVFDTDQPKDLATAWQRCKQVLELQEKVAKEEMVSHHFINNDWKQQETLFADGTRVIVDFNTQSYKIERS